MTKAEIKAILDRERTWPEDRQADLARVALLIEAQQDELEPENEATKSGNCRGTYSGQARKFASDRRVKATWSHAKDRRR
jgi:hypothetical protein